MLGRLVARIAAAVTPTAPPRARTPATGAGGGGSPPLPPTPAAAETLTGPTPTPHSGAGATPTPLITGDAPYSDNVVTFRHGPAWSWYSEPTGIGAIETTSSVPSTTSPSTPSDWLSSTCTEPDADLRSAVGLGSYSLRARAVRAEPPPDPPPSRPPCTQRARAPTPTEAAASSVTPSAATTAYPDASSLPPPSLAPPLLQMIADSYVAARIENPEWEPKLTALPNHVWLRAADDTPLHGLTVSPDLPPNVVVPDSESAAPLRKLLLTYAHDAATSIHNGRDATLARLRMGGFTWHGVYADVSKYCGSCVTCQRFKTPTPAAGPFGSMGRPEEATRPGQIVELDFLGPFPASYGDEYTHALVMVDRFTGYTVAVPTKGQTADVALHAFTAGWVGYFGFPESISTDGGPGLDNYICDWVTDRVGMKHHVTTPHNPRSMGKVERTNGKLLGAMRTILAGRAALWAAMLPLLVYGLNSASSRVHGKPAADLQLSFPSSDTNPLTRAAGAPATHADAPPPTPRMTPAAYQAAAAVMVVATNDLVRAAAADAHREAAKCFDSTHVPSLLVLAANTLIWIISANISTGLRPNKLTAMKNGPYIIVQVLDGGRRLLVRDMLTGKHLIIPPSRALLLNATRFDQLTDVVIVNLRANEQVVQAVCGRRRSAGTWQLLIKWHGWGNFMTWEPERDLLQVTIVRRYLNLPVDDKAPYVSNLKPSAAGTLAAPAELPDILNHDEFLAEEDVDFYLNPVKPPGEGHAGPPPPYRRLQAAAAAANPYQRLQREAAAGGAAAPRSPPT